MITKKARSVRLTRGLANLISDGQILGQGKNLGKKSLKEKTVLRIPGYPSLPSIASSAKLFDHYHFSDSSIPDAEFKSAPYVRWQT